MVKMKNEKGIIFNGKEMGLNVIKDIKSGRVVQVFKNYKTDDENDVIECVVQDNKKIKNLKDGYIVTLQTLLKGHLNKLFTGKNEPRKRIEHKSKSSDKERKALNDIVNSCKLGYMKAWNIISVKFNIPNNTNRSIWLQENGLSGEAINFLCDVLSK